MAALTSRVLFKDYNIETEFRELLPTPVAGKHAHHVEQNAPFFRWIDNFIMRKEQDLQDISNETIRPIYLGSVASLYGAGAGGFMADMSEDVFRRFILWIQDILYKGANGNNISTFLLEQLNVTLIFSTHRDYYDYMDASTYKQSMFDIYVQYDLSSAFSILSEADLSFIIETLSGLVPAYTKSAIITNPVVYDTVPVSELVEVATLAQLLEKMTFPYVQVDNLDGNINIPYSGMDPNNPTQPIIPYPENETEWRDFRFQPYDYMPCEIWEASTFQNTTPGRPPVRLTTPLAYTGTVAPRRYTPALNTAGISPVGTLTAERL